MQRYVLLLAALCANACAHAHSKPHIHTHILSDITPESNKGDIDPDTFTIGAWYSGGKYRAPTVSRDPKKERAEWLQVAHMSSCTRARTNLYHSRKTRTHSVAAQRNKPHSHLETKR